MDERHKTKLAFALAFFAPLFASSAAMAATEAKAAEAGGGALWLFYIFAALVLAGAGMTISRRNPVSAALWLVFTLFCTAGIYLSLHATFMAAIQILVYAGAVMVLFLFVVMSVGNTEHEEFGFLRGWVSKTIGLAALAALGWRLFPALVKAATELGVPVTLTEKSTYGDVSSMSKVLFSDYLFPFEAISVLLLVAIVGAVVVSRRQGDDKREEA